jgi:hypothetical protein
MVCPAYPQIIHIPLVFDVASLESMCEADDAFLKQVSIDKRLRDVLNEMQQSELSEKCCHCQETRWI